MKATIVNTVENTTNVTEIPEAVTDLAGLKHFLNIEDGQFYEGTSRTDLTLDSQTLPVLPESKKERGYVFFVSPAQNKIKNGAYSRKECYNIIKANNLGDVVKNKYGRNFTQVATDALNEVISDNSTVTVETAPVEDTDAGKITTEKDLWLVIANIFTVADSEKDEALRILKEGIERVFPTPYSVQDLANMRK